MIIILFDNTKVWWKAGDSKSGPTIAGELSTNRRIRGFLSIIYNKKRYKDRDLHLLRALPYTLIYNNGCKDGDD